MKNKKIGVYVHIPFCKQKCYYCDFISYCNKDNLIEDYVKAVKKEIRMQNIQSQITTVYIGGGTPSYIDSKYIVEIIDEIKKKNLSKRPEITIEVNPGTVTKEKLKDYKKCGINRLSIGLQMARKGGFKNINVDLILGIPNQKIKDLKDSLEKIIELQPEHISVYSLIVEDGTPIANKIEKGELELPDEDTERNMYWYVKNTLELNGYIHYEISNFAKKGRESKHNKNCWNQNQYFGFGAAAHSYRDITRYSNTEKIEEYIKNVMTERLDRNRIIHEIQKEYDAEKEYMLLGLRKIVGVNISEFKLKFGDNPIYLFRNELQKLVEEDLLEVDLDDIKLTSKGLDS